jgi:RNA polymerase sigma-70 factor (ECF subfamily)
MMFSGARPFSGSVSPPGNAPGVDLASADLERRFTALLDAHGPSLARLAGSYTRDGGERDDLFQEITLAIWRALPSFRGDCSERTFIFRVAHNRGLAFLSRRRPDVTAFDEAGDPPAAIPSPEQVLSTEQQTRRLAAAVQRLPVGYRQVVTLTLEGLSYRETADVVGISESNVGARLTRARQILRRLLQSQPH